MASSPQPQRTDFTLDLLGRFLCNGGQAHVTGVLTNQGFTPCRRTAWR